MKVVRKSLLFKNIIRQNFKNWVQTLLMIGLILISSLLFMLVLFSNKTLTDAENKTNRISNLHDFVVDFDNSQYIGKTNVNYNNENYYENALESAANLQTNNYNNKFIWDRVETRNLYLDRNSNTSTFIKAVTDNPNARIDKLIVTDGYDIGQNPNITIAPSNQIVIEKQFALFHHINIGSIIRLAADNKGSAMKISSSGDTIPAGYNWFKVVGYGMSADYEAPIFQKSDIIPDKKNNALVYVDPSQFGLTSHPTQFNNGDLYWDYNISNDKWSKLSSSDSEIYYVGKFVNGSTKNTNLISQYLSSKYNNDYQSNDSLTILNSNKNKTLIMNAINNSQKLKDDFNLYPSIMDREKNIKNDIENIICKTLKISWDSRWNINIFTDSSCNNYFDYTNNSTSNLYIQINQNLLQNETVINNCNLIIKNPFNILKNNNYLQNNNSVNIKEIVDNAITALIDDKSKPFSTFSSSNLNVGSGQNIDNLKNDIKSKILNYCSSSYSAILNQISNYLDANLAISFNKNLNSTTTNISGNLFIKINNDKIFSPIPVNEINLNLNGWVYFNDNTNPDNKFAYKLGDSSYKFNSRTDDLEKGIDIFNAFTSIMLIIILIISGVILVLIVKKNIYHMQKQLGVLKSLGYKNSTIILSYISLPTYLIIFSTAIAYPLAILSQYILTLIISNYFNLVFTGINFAFSGVVFIVCVAFLFVFLTIISLLTCWAMLSRPITEVLYNTKKVKVYRFVEVLKRPLAKSKFKVRFSAAMLFKSLDKLLLLSSTLLLTIIIFSSVIIFPFIMNDNKKYSTIDWNYNNLVQYQNPVWNSPYSFYKTYNPTSTSAIPSAEDGQAYIKAFEDPNEAALSANYYSYNTDSPTAVGLKLINLTNKIFSKDFLTSLDESGGWSPGWIMSNAWEDYNKIFNVWKNYDSLSNQIKYNTYRNFYNTYKNVALLSINPDFRVNQLWKTGYKNISFNNSDIKSNLSSDKLTINWNNSNFDVTDTSQADSKIGSAKSLTDDLTIDNDTDFVAYNYTQMNAAKKTAEINDYIKDFNTLFMSVYYGRLSQAIVAETYGQAPYQLRTQMKQNLETPGKDFNLTFNVVPYNPLTDQLGLMFNANFNSQKFNIYGIDSSSKMQLLNLENTNNHSIQNLIKKPSKNDDNAYNIIINKSLEKKLNWQQGQEYDLGTYLKQLNIDGKSFDQNNNFDTSNVFSNTTGDVRDINYGKAEVDGQKIYNSNPLNIKPTISQQWVQNGKMAFANSLKNIKVKIIGIDRSYGEAKAYINNDDAMQIMNYQKSREFLFNKMFKSEWSSNFPKLTSINSYDELASKAETDNDMKKLLTMFNNEYPIFNYKMSQDKALYDVSSSLAVSNLYGDYSKIGLHGGYAKIPGYSSAIYWNSNATPSIYTLITKQIFNSTIDSVNKKVTSFLLAIFAFAVGIILIIVIAVSDVIFYENKRVILSMKVLGYSSWDITKSIFGFYLIIALITFIIGFPLSFYLIKWIISLTTLAVPVFLNWQIPIILLTLLVVTFGLIFYINFNSIKKLRAIQEINNYD